MSDAVIISLWSAYLNPRERDEPTARYGRTYTSITGIIGKSHQTGLRINERTGESTGSIGNAHLIYIIGISRNIV